MVCRMEWGHRRRPPKPPICTYTPNQPLSVANKPERMVRAQAEQAMRKNGRQADPNTPYYLGATLLLLFVAVVGYVVYVNQKLKEAGLLDRKVGRRVCVFKCTLDRLVDCWIAAGRLLAGP